MLKIMRLAFVVGAVLVVSPVWAAALEGGNSSAPVPPPSSGELKFADDFSPTTNPVSLVRGDDPSSSSTHSPATPAVPSAPASSGAADYYGADYYTAPAPLATPAVSPVQKAISPDISGGTCGAGAGVAPGSHALRIAVGDGVADRLAAWLSGYGYTLAWEAPSYRADGPLTLEKGFDGTLRAVKEALEMHGIKLDITVYENCAVRVVGAK